MDADERKEVMENIISTRNHLIAISDYLASANQIKRKILTQLKLTLPEMKGVFQLIQSNTEDDEILNIAKESLSLLSLTNKRLAAIKVI